MNATEKDYELLENLGAKLHIATPTAKWGIKVEKDGVVLLDTIERAHSWTRNAYNLLVSQMSAAAVTGKSAFSDGQLNLKATNGVVYGASGYIIGHYNPSQSIESPQYGGFVSDNGDATKGIVVGTGNTAYSFEDYQLSAQVTHGVADGQLSYTLSTIAKEFDTITKKYNVTHERIFYNNSAASITIKEVGIIGGMVSDAGGVTARKCLLCRDILGTAPDVPAGAKITITYTMSTQFPG